jgi:hypothetical protein
MDHHSINGGPRFLTFRIGAFTVKASPTSCVGATPDIAVTVLLAVPLIASMVHPCGREDRRDDGAENDNQTVSIFKRRSGGVSGVHGRCAGAGARAAGAGGDG